MDAILCAEIYLICIVFAAILAFWTQKSDTNSTSELWMKRMLRSFLLCFGANFLFTVFNRILVLEAAVLPLSYALKTLYFIALITGVFCWCGYAEACLNSRVFEKRKNMRLLYVPLLIALAMPLLNLFTHWLFDFGEGYAYRRHFLYPLLLALLLILSTVCSIRLLQSAGKESVPAQRMHLFLTAAIPLCLFAALILSCAGEEVPVICFCLTVELLCICLGTARQQISIDHLTQVNNRQNLIGFMEYKLKNHSGDLYLLMIDVDDFKAINDTKGHLAGDKALTEIANILKRTCGPLPKRPYIARYGGDEFIIVMEASQGDIDLLCESINSECEAFSARSDSFRLSVSIGCAKWREGMDHKALIAQADAELYRHKHTRRA
ncbi:MAG: GGDEF domain-containing protein [Clostridia bacterium]|nr:GGDEF domain-containing protein [Clostridia bacterium]